MIDEFNINILLTNDMSNYATKLTPELDIYVVAKWDDGSFLRIPAIWLDDGEIRIPTDALDEIANVELADRPNSRLLEISGHLKYEAREFTVHQRRNGGQSFFQADRSSLPDWYQAKTHRMLDVPILTQHTPLDLYAGDVEAMLSGIVGLIDEYTKIENGVAGGIIRLVEEINAFTTPVRMGMPRNLQTRFKDNYKMSLPKATTKILTDCVEYVSIRTMACNTDSLAPDYSSLLAIEDCSRYLKRQLKSYLKAFYGCKESLIEINPAMERFYPEFGDITPNESSLAQTKEVWPGKACVRSGISIIRSRESSLQYQRSVVTTTPSSSRQISPRRQN